MYKENLELQSCIKELEEELNRCKFSCSDTSFDGDKEHKERTRRSLVDKIMETKRLLTNAIADFEEDQSNIEDEEKEIRVVQSNRWANIPPRPIYISKQKATPCINVEDVFQPEFDGIIDSNQNTQIDAPTRLTKRTSPRRSCKSHRTVV